VQRRGSDRATPRSHSRAMTVMRGPFGIDATRGATLTPQRSVLAVLHTVTSGARLGDVVPLLESDPRIQVLYTHPPAALFAAGTRDFLKRLGGVRLPWQLATQHRFSLALAAHPGLLEQVHAPVVSLPHGAAGYSKLGTRWDMAGPQATREAAGPDRARLVYHGRVIASAHLLPTREDASLLLRSCPEASPVTHVTGDPTYDRLLASVASRQFYRDVIGTGDRTLVTVSSTWGPGSLLNVRPGILTDLMRQLPRHRYQVAAILHPNTWYWHGIRQTTAWLASCLEAGLILVPPEEGWRALVAASDLLIGDYGSLIRYAAAVGVPVVIGSHPADEVVPESPADELAAVAPHLNHDSPYLPQLESAIASWLPERRLSIQSRITDLPGRAASEIRSRLYALLDLTEPESRPRTEPVPPPRPVRLPRTFGSGW
jgi:hypothetical protein